MENNLKFNSAICTSREQSERLLALGLKKETADMMYEGKLSGEIARFMPHKTEMDYFNLWDSIIPAWSLHRLLEMMPEDIESDDWLGVSFDDVSYYHGAGEDMISWKYYKAGTNLYDCIIECYEWLIKEGYFNKEYLV